MKIETPYLNFNIDFKQSKILSSAKISKLVIAKCVRTNYTKAMRKQAEEVNKCPSVSQIKSVTWRE